MNQTRYNQTQFSLEEPFLQPSQAPIKQAPPVLPPGNSQQVSDKRRTRYLVIAGGVVALIVLLFVIVLLSRSGSTGQILPSFPQSSLEPKQVTDLEIQIEEYSQVLEDTDPTKQSLVFPPVNMYLRLEDLD